MHTVHHTDAFILKIRPAGEANVRVWLFTRDFGLIVASVQGVRKQGAKLQMQLSEYSLVTIDLVRGRDVWRLVSITQLDAPLLDPEKVKAGRVLARTFTAVERFCQGEEIHHELFEHLRALFNCFARKDIDQSSLDTLSLWRVMLLLGYSTEEEDSELLDAPLLETTIKLTPAKKKRLIARVSETIEHTHL